MYSQTKKIQFSFILIFKTQYNRQQLRMKNTNNKSGISSTNPKTNRSLKTILSNCKNPTSTQLNNTKKQNYENNRQYMSYFEKLKFMINNNRKYKNLNSEQNIKLGTIEQQTEIKSKYQILNEQRQSLIPVTRNKSQINYKQGKSIDKIQLEDIPITSIKNHLSKTYKLQIVNYKKGFQQIVESDYTFDKIQLSQVLGTGANASVRLGSDKMKNYKYAIKIYQKYKLLEPRKLKNVYKQIKLMKKLDHPNIISLYAAYQDKKQIHLLMEYFQGDTLMQYFRSNMFHLQQHIIKNIIKQLVHAVSYMHQNNISHRDIKLENILINPNTYEIKLIDFGFATFNVNRCQIHCGTPNYMAPELFLKNSTYDAQKVDVWAIGIVIYYLIEGIFPFKGYDEKDLARKIKSGEFSIKKGNYNFQELIRDIFELNPDRRLGCSEIYTSTWLATN